MAKGTIYDDLIGNSNISGTDTAAIHDDVAAEIIAVTAKATPVGADVVLIEDTESSNVKKRATITTVVGAAGTIAALSAKAAPLMADLLMIDDTAASNAKKKTTIREVKAACCTILEPIEDAIPTITDAVGTIVLTNSATGDKEIITDVAGAGAVQAGQQVWIRLLARDDGSYTLPVTGGDLTFNATGEVALVARNAANDAWTVILLSGATVV